MDAAGEGEGETKFQTFIEQPAILDKYKAAAVVSDGKNPIPLSKFANNHASDLYTRYVQNEVFFISLVFYHMFFMTSDYFYFSCP